MRLPLLSGYTFKARSRTLDMTGVAGFDVRRLASVMNLTAAVEIYALAEPSLGFTAYDNGVLTLAFDTRPMSDSDILFVMYEDGINPLPPDAATNTKLEALRAAVAGSIVVADTSGVLAAGAVATPVAANLTRQFIEITNTGADALSYRWGAAASAEAGHVLSPGESARYDSKVPTAALSLFSQNGTKFFVTTG